MALSGSRFLDVHFASEVGKPTWNLRVPLHFRGTHKRRLAYAIR
jgi:hypothetical protein